MISRSSHSVRSLARVLARERGERRARLLRSVEELARYTRERERDRVARELAVKRGEGR